MNAALMKSGQTCLSSIQTPLGHMQHPSIPSTRFGARLWSACGISQNGLRTLSPTLDSEVVPMIATTQTKSLFPKTIWKMTLNQKTNKIQKISLSQIGMALSLELKIQRGVHWSTTHGYCKPGVALCLTNGHISSKPSPHASSVK